ncbi:hypothetical protein BDL97_17G105200 [Sphagnum fallax]|nr:hypothetical protein BDL97_17G105200 [Sphagnum fallax]KAH8936832.1 hypothetical protein BDL97_17G105200 [Sphagnum fallax]
MVAYKNGSLSNSQQGHSGGHPIQLGPGSTRTTTPPGSAGMAQLQQQRIAVPRFTLPATLPIPFGNEGTHPQEFSLTSNGYLANNSHGLELANRLHGSSYNFSLLTAVAFMKP